MSDQSMLGKFKAIESRFNRSYLTLLFQLREQVAEDEQADSDERSEKEKEQSILLDEAYGRWYYEITDDARTTTSTEFLYAAIGDNHNLIQGRDEQLFTKDGDFLSMVFDQEGLDTPFLYDLLPDGLDEECGPTDDNDGKSNLWGALMGLYRLSILIVIYLKNSLVSDIINLILAGSPDINQSNIFENICKQFKGKRKLRKLIMKLLKSKDDCFGDIFTSLQRVIGTFGGDMSMDKGMKANMDASKTKQRDMFETLLADQKVSVSDDQQTTLLHALDSGSGEDADLLVSAGVLTIEQLTNLRESFKTRGLDKMNVSKVVSDLGGTMKSMMDAINSGNEDDMKKVLEQSGAGMNFEDMGLDMTELQAEMDEFEVEK